MQDAGLEPRTQPPFEIQVLLNPARDPVKHFCPSRLRKEVRERRKERQPREGSLGEGGMEGVAGKVECVTKPRGKKTVIGR